MKINKWQSWKLDSKFHCPLEKLVCKTESDSSVNCDFIAVWTKALMSMIFHTMCCGWILNILMGRNTWLGTSWNFLLLTRCRRIWLQRVERYWRSVYNVHITMYMYTRSIFIRSVTQFARIDPFSHRVCYPDSLLLHVLYKFHKQVQFTIHTGVKFILIKCEHFLGIGVDGVPRVSLFRPGPNVELHFGSTQIGKARPLGQTSNIIRRTKFSHKCFDIETKIFIIIQNFNWFVQFDSWKDRRLSTSRS